MRLHVSIPDNDVASLDAYARSRSIPSRSAVLERAVGLLRLVEIGRNYEDAFNEWAASGEGDLWDSATADGMNH
ncbi:MAG: ribbon-helix-helix protein, CopG family [Acidimicrobiales bacterium]